MFRPGSSIVVREVWDGLLWAARPAIVVADDGEELVHWMPAGTMGCFATSRGYPGRDQLRREERQLVALQTKRWRYRGVPARGTKLSFVRQDAWVGVEATWDRTGSFVHWYVNFQVPPRRIDMGYETLDLVLDILVAPDWSWSWKDEAPFDVAVRDGIFDTEVKIAILGEAEKIQQLIESRSGPFDARWVHWKAPIEWPDPVLPDEFAAGTDTPPGAASDLANWRDDHGAEG